jgi:hypothetical protein
VEIHQFRIEADSGQPGLPTPEGAHRDGVDWVCVLLVNRCNVSSGITQIFDPEGRSLGEFALTNPLDAVFLDDRRVLHSSRQLLLWIPRRRRSVMFWCLRSGAMSRQTAPDERISAN